MKQILLVLGLGRADAEGEKVASGVLEALVGGRVT